MLTRVLKNGILAAWAFFFLWLFSFGQSHLARLLHPRLWWLTLCGAVVLVLFIAVNLRRPAALPGQISLRWRWPSLLILLVPLLYFLPMQKARFNGQTFARRTVQTETNFIGQGNTPVPQANDDTRPEDDSASDRMDAFQRLMEQKDDTRPEEASSSEVPLTRLFTHAEQYKGKAVEVVCQSLQDQRLPDDLLICYRFRITCCAADAQPVFVFVKKAAGGPPVANDTWIRAKGPLSLHQNGSVRIPLISADSITTEEEPSFPFIL